MKDRLAKYREKLLGSQLESALIVTSEKRINKNVFYMTGFTGEDGYLYVSHDRAILFVDGRYPEQAREQVWDGISVQLAEFPIIDFIGRQTADFGIRNMGIEESVVSHAFAKKLAEKCEGIEVKCADNLIEPLRQIKSREEIERIRQACKVADDAFNATLPHVKAGASEMDISVELDYQMKRRGALKASFDIIVASGFRGAMAHGVASDKKIQNGEFVVFDWGCVFNGYCSDCTRTIVVGEPTEKHREIYNLVRAGQEAAMACFKPGVKCADADKASREPIIAGGYPNSYNHSLGHGVGLDIHESPGASSRSEQTFEEDMVCTNEPGLYFEGWGGVRIEDTVWISKDGAVPLNTLPKEMIVI
jgi:Xaa-Pro aminopeptidase